MDLLIFFRHKDEGTVVGESHEVGIKKKLFKIDRLMCLMSQREKGI